LSTLNIAVLAGDGIGPEITEQAVAVLERLAAQGQFALNLEHAAVGGAGYRAKGHPLPEGTLALAQKSQAILFGSVGDFSLDHLPRELRPEQAILGLRKALGLFANLRPAVVFPELGHASTLKPEIVSGMDILIVRELTGDIYFGQPRGIRRLDNGDREGFDTMVYNETEIRRIGRVAFEAAAKRSRRLCSVDKANVLETTQLWRDVMTELAADYPNIELSHMYVDNAAMQLLKNPKQFDVMVTGNMFGDILSDEASMLTGSIGMLASASLDSNNKGLYEPIHGSAPDIAGQDKANPLATILSAAMMLRYSFGLEASAQAIEQAVSKVLGQGYATADIQRPGAQMVGTKAMGQAVVAALG
jgi:3-isopropylmalate dehydrogenase